MGTKEQWAQRNSGQRGTVGTEEQWAQRKGRHVEIPLAHRNNRNRGTVDTEEQWAWFLKPSDLKLVHFFFHPC